MGNMIPSEMLEKILYMKATGKSCIDLVEEYNKVKIRSKISYNRAKSVFENLDKMMENREYVETMSMLKFSEKFNSRDKLRNNFSNMMFFYEKINPNWLKSYNEIEDSKTGNMSANVEEKDFSMKNLVDEALSLPDITYGNISPEKMRDIRISALTMFYANKIAHQSQYLRETYLSYLLNYVEKSNDSLNDALKNGKFKEISNKLRECYKCKIAYREAKERRRKARCFTRNC